MKYLVAEKFKSIQGEGVYCGTPMAFIRFVGCSVGKRICQHCDTIFEKTLPWQGGGEYEIDELLEWVGNYRHICLTGGEPLNQELQPLIDTALKYGRFMIHIETSGTVPIPPYVTAWKMDEGYVPERIWICVSPKPGYLTAALEVADEIKIIVPGLGNGEGWMTPEEAIAWSRRTPTFLQPRNGRFDIDKQNLLYVQDFIRDHPSLRLSLQLHKLLKVQ